MHYAACVLPCRLWRMHVAVRTLAGVAHGWLCALGRSGLRGIVVPVVLSILSLFPDAVPVWAQTATGPPGCGDWVQSVIGPAERPLKPVGAWWSNGEQLREAELHNLLETDDASVRLTQPGQRLIVDFGEVVSGKIEADVLDASGVPVVFSTSDALDFLSDGSAFFAASLSMWAVRFGRQVTRAQEAQRRGRRTMSGATPELPHVGGLFHATLAHQGRCVAIWRQYAHN
jgi:hypothetical protein